MATRRGQLDIVRSQSHADSSSKEIVAMGQDVPSRTVSQQEVTATEVKAEAAIS